MPKIGLGTYKMQCEETIFKAIVEAGYRHLDTAMIYKNEEVVGRAINRAIKSGIPREEFWVTTKLWVTDKHDVEQALKTSLQKLNLDYVDLYLIHWPYCLRPDMDSSLNWTKKHTPLSETW